MSECLLLGSATEQYIAITIHTLSKGVFFNVLIYFILEFSTLHFAFKPTPPRDITVHSRRQADTVFVLMTLMRRTQTIKDLMNPLPVYEIEYSYLGSELID